MSERASSVTRSMRSTASVIGGLDASRVRRRTTLDEDVGGVNAASMNSLLPATAIGPAVGA
jgi:hypothetical protein